MLRFFIGFALGVLLTTFSFRFIGVGHGTYVPMAFSGSLVALIPGLGAIVSLVLVPLLWAFYFLYIPRIPKRSLRIACGLFVMALHLLTGISLALEDSAFTRSLQHERGPMLYFALLLAIAFASLFLFIVRGSRMKQNID